MRGEKLAHLEFFLGFRISVIAGKICLLEIVQSSDTCVAVVDALLRNEVLAGIDGKRIFSFTSARLSRGICWGMMAYMLLLLMVKTETPRKEALRGAGLNFS